MILIWAKFLICVLIIVLAGKKAARYGDAISEKTGLGELWVGVTFLAIITSIPELFTGIGAVALVKEPDLAIGDLFGSNILNLLIIALLDVAYNNGVLLTVVTRGGHLRTAAMGIVLAGLASAFVMISSTHDMGIGWLGLYTPIILLLYLLAMKVVFSYERSHPQEEEEESKYEEMSLRRTYLLFGLSGVFIIGAAIWMAFIGDEIANRMHWEQSFVGSVFIAVTTSLPEVVVSFTALRIGAVNMAVGNMLGSNLCNMAIIGIVDLFYWEAPVLSAVSQSNAFTGLIVLFMSGIVIAGLLLRTEHKPRLRASWYALALIILYLAGVYAAFAMAG